MLGLKMNKVVVDQWTADHLSLKQVRSISFCDKSNMYLCKTFLVLFLFFRIILHQGNKNLIWFHCVSQPNIKFSSATSDTFQTTRLVPEYKFIVGRPSSIFKTQKYDLVPLIPQYALICLLCAPFSEFFTSRLCSHQCIRFSLVIALVLEIICGVEWPKCW